MKSVLHKVWHQLMAWTDSYSRARTAAILSRMGEHDKARALMMGPSYWD